MDAKQLKNSLELVTFVVEFEDHKSVLFANDATEAVILSQAQAIKDGKLYMANRVKNMDSNEVFEVSPLAILAI